MLVLDASVALGWCFEDEGPGSIMVLQALRTDEAIVPSIWPLEVGNALLVGERRGRLTSADARRFVELLRGLPITLDLETGDRGLADVLAVARERGLTTYDAAYLELAMRLGIPLATADERLVAAAAAEGVALFTSPPSSRGASP
jgi:predicted nucleic acid-binding protein